MPSTTAAALAAVLSSVASVASAFTTPSSSATTSATTNAGKTQLYSTVDPTVVTKKEYQDICGVDFDDNALTDRLKKTAYLYPKHVEVIEDFEPLVNKMVDDIVSSLLLLKGGTGDDVSMLNAQLVIKPLQLTIISHSPSLSLILHYNADASHSL